MNLLAIADGLVARYVGITATVGAESRTLQAADVTNLLPNEIAKGPMLLIYPPTGEAEIGTSAIRQGEVIYFARLLNDPLDAPSRTAWLYAWDAAMRDRVEQNSDLDLPSYVAEAQVGRFRLELDGQTYGVNKYDVVEHEVIVTLYEQSVSVGV